MSIAQMFNLEIETTAVDVGTEGTVNMTETVIRYINLLGRRSQRVIYTVSVNGKAIDYIENDEAEAVRLACSYVMSQTLDSSFFGF
jgi:hypothetical protein